MNEQETQFNELATPFSSRGNGTVSAVLAKSIFTSVRQITPRELSRLLMMPQCLHLLSREMHRRNARSRQTWSQQQPLQPLTPLSRPLHRLRHQVAPHRS